MAQKIGIPKGTRDFNPEMVQKRNYILNIFRKHFKTFGFQPIETPSFENYDTLIGKYGKEGDRLIFKILNSGDYLKKANTAALLDKNTAELTRSISEKALRYDLTVPFARYVVMHQNQIVFPFKRYQIQTVWRADRPQKGRFREFCQCDADVLGGKSLWQEVELIQLYDTVFKDLCLEGVTIQLNHRKILSGIAEVFNFKIQLGDFMVALDKLTKIGIEGVKKELLQKGFKEKTIEKTLSLFSFEGTNVDKLSKLRQILSTSTIGLEGIADLEFICEKLEFLGLQTIELMVDITLARGLHYYTGTIFEVFAPKTVAMGAIGGGGRYDELTRIFGLENVEGIGISFGLDRIYMVMETLDLFPKQITSSLQVLFINFGEKETLYAMQIITQLRNCGIATDIYPKAIKVQKQMQYSHKRNISYVVMIGEEEIQNQTIIVKKMVDGSQKKLYSTEELLTFLNIDNR